MTLLHLFGVSWYTQRVYKKSGGDGVETCSQISIDIVEYQSVSSAVKFVGLLNYYTLLFDVISRIQRLIALIGDFRYFLEFKFFALIT